MIEPGDVYDYLSDISLLLPGVLASTLVALVVGGWVGRRVGSGRLIGTLLIVALGLIVSATLTPSREALRFGALGSSTCDLSRIRVAPLSEVLLLHDAGFNILLYAPLGLVVGTMRPRWSGVGWLVAGSLLSPAIETIQMLLRPLDRACQASDVIDNLTGFVIGVAFAVAIRLVLSLLWPDPPRASDAPPVPGA